MIDWEWLVVAFLVGFLFRGYVQAAKRGYAKAQAKRVI